MPRKTKETGDNEIVKIANAIKEVLSKNIALKKTDSNKAKTAKKTSTSKKSAAKKSSATKAATTKKASSAKTSAAKKTTTTKKDNSKKATATKTTAVKKATATKSTGTKKSTTAKTADTKKTATTKTTGTKKASTTKSAASKKTATKKASSTKAAKTVTPKKASASKSTSAKKEAATIATDSKKATTTKKASTKKAKTTTTKKKSSTKSTAKKTTTKKAPVASDKNFSAEYYDLPFRYNQTVVKILAQTPKNLFIYWEISDKDRLALKKQYGDYFFEITKPVLIIYNETLKYTFEVDIDDFANSWYLHVDDSNSEYKVELGRRPIPVSYNYIPDYNIEKNGPIEEIKTPYVYISSSNDLDAPNDKILFNKISKIYFKNVKTNELVKKDISDFPFIYKDGIFINIYKLYQELYKEEIKNDSFNIYNPSSGNISSGSFSSRFY